MSVKIIPEEKQGKGQFNAGQILENKPIGFPQDGGEGKPYSNLFYWAHAWTPGEQSLIGEHPHQGFEIMSFVLKGSLKHYDSKLKDWRTLDTGDAQIIRAGNGITHAEMVNDHSEFFQIWMDPNLEFSLAKEASYDDYKSMDFPVVEEAKGIEAKIYKGENAPMEMDSKGVEIKMLQIEPGDYDYKIDKTSIHSLYVVNGDLSINGQEMKKKDFAIIKDEEEAFIKTSEKSQVFVIKTPAILEYKTYAERFFN